MGVLALSRRRNEKILLRTPDGTVVALTVLEIRGDKVRLVFDAPRTVEIVREEVLQRSGWGAKAMQPTALTCEGEGNS